MANKVTIVIMISTIIIISTKSYHHSLILKFLMSSTVGLPGGNKKPDILDDTHAPNTSFTARKCAHVSGLVLQLLSPIWPHCKPPPPSHAPARSGTEVARGAGQRDPQALLAHNIFSVQSVFGRAITKCHDHARDICEQIVWRDERQVELGSGGDCVGCLTVG
jgi:hypothetical protein